MSNKRKRMKVRTIRFSDSDWAAVIRMKLDKLRLLIRKEDARAATAAKPPKPTQEFFI